MDTIDGLRNVCLLECLNVNHTLQSFLDDNRFDLEWLKNTFEMTKLQQSFTHIFSEFIGEKLSHEKQCSLFLFSHSTLDHPEIWISRNNFIYPTNNREVPSIT